MTALTDSLSDTHTLSTPSSFSCFSGILLGLNPFDNIARASRTDTAFNKYASVSAFLILFLWLFANVHSNFIKSGITEHYAHADPDDALTVTMLV